MDSKVTTEYDGRKRRVFSKECIVCKRTFWVPRHRFEIAVTCSSACRCEFFRKRKLLLCSMCGKEFLRTASKMSNSKSGLHFCSRSCKDRAQRLDNGFTAIHPPHYGKVSKEYRKTAFRLLGSQCASCGYDRNSKMLDVHHRNSDRSDNRIENLVVLCVWCHMLVTRGVGGHAWNGDILKGPTVISNLRSLQKLDKGVVRLV